MDLQTEWEPATFHWARVPVEDDGTDKWCFCTSSPDPHLCRCRYMQKHRLVNSKLVRVYNSADPMLREVPNHQAYDVFLQRPPPKD